MKHGILIYQVPAMTDRTVFAEDYDFADFSFLGIGKGKRYLDTLKAEFIFRPEIVKYVTNISFQGLAIAAFDGQPCVFHQMPKLFNAIKLRTIRREKIKCHPLFFQQSHD